MSKSPLSPRTMVAYLERELAPSEARQVEAALAESPEAQRRLESYRAIADALGSPEPELEALDLAGAVRARAARQTKPGRRWRPARWHLWSSALAAAACVALVVGLSGRRPDDNPHAKGAAGSAEDRWAGVRLFRAEGGPARPLGSVIGRREGVLVSYSNLGPTPFGYLMVFAVDARGEVAWLHPAWERAEENPVSIAIASGVTARELPSLIHPSWTPGPVTIHALFTRQPLHVREVEALRPADDGRLPIADSAQQIFHLAVEP
jgi:hypothetical protein